jgi:aminoglycoside 6'-N-acetyltransferase I
VRIVELREVGKRNLERAAKLLVEEFRIIAPRAWPDRQSAREEVSTALQNGKPALAALDVAGRLEGWVGAIPHYGGGVWEIHPLVVSAEFQGLGVGTSLLRQIEFLAHREGVRTLWVGADDEGGLTTLSGVDLYHNLPDHLARMDRQRPHPAGFYMELGFHVVGVMPDANGPGMPDIFLAKRVELADEASALPLDGASKR